MWTHMYHRIHMELREHLRILAPAFYLVLRQESLNCFSFEYTTLAGPQAPASYLRTGVLGLQMLALLCLTLL